MKVTRVSGYPGLYREELGKEGSRFRIVIHHKNEKTQEYFYFGAKRSEADARAEAIKRWQEIRKTTPVMSRVEFAQVERRKSRTGIVGVRRVPKTVKGHEYYFWEGWWSDRRHNRRVRCFSVDKYGEEEAKKLAIKARRDGLAEIADA
jgi:hypothetical protein